MIHSEAETGIKVYYNEFPENEDIYPIIAAGAVQYDVVCPSDYMVQKMIENDLLTEIDYSKIPNISNIDPEYLKKRKTLIREQVLCPLLLGHRGNTV